MAGIPNIRIGNTITVSFPVFTGGEAVSLLGRLISVVLIDPRGEKKNIEFELDEDNLHIVRFVVEGIDQTYTGIYRVIVCENAELKSQTLFDKKVFNLVSETDKENFDDGLAVKNLELSGGSLLVGGMPGTSVVLMEQVSSSTESEGENVWRAMLSNGNTFDFVVRNGKKGEKGDAGDAVYVKRVYKNYEYTGGIQYVMEFSDGSTYPFVAPRGNKGDAPVRGIDYWTEEDIHIIVEEAKDALEHQIPIADDDTPIMDGVASAGIKTTYARGDHRHPSDANKQDVIPDLDTIRSKASTAYQKPSIGIPKTDLTNEVKTLLDKADTAMQREDIPTASSTTPKANGTASAGIEAQWAKGDHVHPTDTTRASLDSPSFVGVPTAPTAARGTDTQQIATTAFVNAAIAASQVVMNEITEAEIDEMFNE